jgi:hypothetical protein
MISMSRKEQAAAVKWCQHRSPIGYLVYTMNGKWGVPHENDENVISQFLKCWKAAKGAVIIQGRKRLEEISVLVPTPQKESLVLSEFINLLMSMGERFRRTERWADMEAFCRDMNALFVWDDRMRDMWLGCVIGALDGQDRLEERDLAFAGHEDSEEIVAAYADCLLKRCDTEKAAKVLAPFEDTSHEEIRKRIDLLRKLQTVQLR